MSEALRYFLIEADDSIVPVPAARFERVSSGFGRAARYAGLRVRVAEVGVGPEQRRLSGAVSERYFVLEFDAVGKVEASRPGERAAAAAPVQRDGNVIDAGARFAGSAFVWKPDATLRRRILALALGHARP